MFPEADQRRLERALELAARLHAADRRQREPYLNHLLRVAIRIIDHYDVRDADVVCAALLHDAVEDHAGELAGGDRQAALAVLAGGSAHGSRSWSRRSPTRPGSPARTSTSSTASTWPPAWRTARGRG